MHAPVAAVAPRRPAWSRIPRLALNSVAAATLSLSLAPASCAPDPAPGVTPRPSYADVAAALETMIERERDQKGLAAMSIALVDDEGVAWAAGFGEQSPGVPATASTVYRVGSVSKLFTDIAVMQLAERGEIDIDAPVRSYLPDFAPDNRSGTAITLRQLMSHRAGLIREPPSGNYFDDSGTDLAATIASLNGLPLIYEPEARIKYSNAGIAVVGYVLEVTRGEPFADYVKRAVIDPIGMRTSAFSREPDLADDLARAYMWGFDRPDFDAPGFDLGMAPAGSMYSTVLDLARFMEVMFQRGARLLSAEPTLRRHVGTPVFSRPRPWTPCGSRSSRIHADGYGLGFAVQERFGERWLGHGGAIYGFSTQLAFLPGSRLGVVVVSAVDGTNTVTSRVADAALELMLAARSGEPLPTGPTRPTTPLDPALVLELQGTYGDGDDALELDARDGRLFMTPARGGATTELRARGDTLIVDDRLAFGDRFLWRAGGAAATTALLPLRPRPRRRTRHTAPPPAPRPPPGPAASPLAGPHRRVRPRPQHPLHPGARRPPPRAHRVVLPVPARGGLTGRVRLPRLGPLPRRAPGLHAGRERARDLGRGGFGRLHAARGRHRGRRHLPHRPRAPGGGVARRGAGRVAARRARPLPRLRAGRGHQPRARDPSRCALCDDQQLHVVGLLRRGARVSPAPRRRRGRARAPCPGRTRLRPPAARRLPPLVRHKDVLRCDPRVAETLRRRSGKRLAPQPRFGDRPEPVRPRHGATGRHGGHLRRVLAAFLPELPRRDIPAALAARVAPPRDGGGGFTVYEAEWWHFDHDDWREYAIQNATFGELGR